MRILTLSTYPIAEPRHGGQHRLSNIVSEYKKAGHSVESAGVIGSPSYPSAPGFLPYPSQPNLNRELSNSIFMEDWAIGRLVARDNSFFDALCSQFRIEPDVIHVEQPWLFQFAHRYAKERASKPIQLIYGSQNIEHELKAKILTSYVLSSLGKAHVDHCVDLIKACELEASTKANIVSAVSEHDAEWARKHSTAEVILAPNGIADRPLTVAGIEAANRLTGHRKYALYCGSAHPPNAVGFFDIFGTGIGCLAPDERFVIAGGAGALLAGDSRFANLSGRGRHVITVGEVPEQTLQGLLACSHLMVLPITQGGGTNLKTAEAIWSGKHIVATSIAMRGFESFIGQSGVTVVDNSNDFKDAVRGAMRSPPLSISSDEQNFRKVVLWESTLRLLVARLDANGIESRQGN